MKFTHEATAQAGIAPGDVWADWSDVHALPRFLSHVRAVAPAETGDLARLVILVDGRHLEFAVERTECDDRTLCWQSLGEMFLYVLSLRLDPAPGGATALTLTVAYDPPGFLPDLAETFGLGRRFQHTLEADLRRYAQAAQSHSETDQAHQPPELLMQPG